MVMGKCNHANMINSRTPILHPWSIHPRCFQDLQKHSRKALLSRSRKFGSNRSTQLATSTMPQCRPSKTIGWAHTPLSTRASSRWCMGSSSHISRLGLLSRRSRPVSTPLCKETSYLSCPISSRCLSRRLEGSIILYCPITNSCCRIKFCDCLRQLLPSSSSTKLNFNRKNLKPQTCRPQALMSKVE